MAKTGNLGFLHMQKHGRPLLNYGVFDTCEKCEKRVKNVIFLEKTLYKNAGFLKNTFFCIFDRFFHFFSFWNVLFQNQLGKNRHILHYFHTFWKTVKTGKNVIFGVFWKTVGSPYSIFWKKRVFSKILEKVKKVIFWKPWFSRIPRC